MYRSILRSRRFLASRQRISSGSMSSSSPPTGPVFNSSNIRSSNTRVAWQASQRMSVSTTPPNNDDDVAPWNSIEGTHNSPGDWDGCRRDFMAPIEIGCRGSDILYNPLFNKGTAFKTEERDRLRFRGLLPARFNNIRMQIERFLVALRGTKSDIQKNIMLEDLHDRNETMYHRVLVDHIEGKLYIHIYIYLLCDVM